jgi:hypothetical protein
MEIGMDTRIEGGYACAMSVAYRMMEGGYIGQCSHEIPQGHCSYCKFDTGLGNWIGLLPDEAPEVAARGTGGSTCLRPLG